MRQCGTCVCPVDAGSLRTSLCASLWDPQTQCTQIQTQTQLIQTHVHNDNTHTHALTDSE